MAHNKVYGFCESGCKVDITPTGTIEPNGGVPVTGKAVSDYAMKKDAAVNTVTNSGTAPVTGKAVADYAVAKAEVKRETWTFTLADGSTVSKVVLLG